MKQLNREQFRTMLDWMMCADPWEIELDRYSFELLLDNEAREWGFDNWIEAYHDLEALPEFVSPDSQFGVGA